LKPQKGFTYDELDNPSSRSKAENVNGALDYLKEEEAGRLRPEIVVLYDADHQPDSNAMIYALETMIFKNADLLQGRYVHVCCFSLSRQTK
jgi:cellulose synthase/poly-beta-1,6-N-acetylglucosamine synthase-like glycosyltransferase